MKQIILALIFIFSTACAAVIPVQPVKIEGTAMVPTLKEGDRIIIDRGFDKLERGDIIIFYFPMDESKSYIKRVIALPNDTIQIDEGRVLINGKYIDEPYVDPKLNESARSMPETRLAADNYFVLGDNRDNSSDSRLWGPVQRRLIYGKYVKKY